MIEIVKRCLVLAVPVFIAATVISLIAFPKARYVCWGNDSVDNQLTFMRDGRFTLNFNYIGQQDRYTVQGHYTEGPNTYDLVFDGLSPDQAKELAGSDTSIPGTKAHRINKDSFFFHHCKMELAK